MDLDLARKDVTAKQPEQVIPALRLLSNEGALTDLQAVLGLLKLGNPTIQKTAIETATTLIRRNLIEHFNELAPQVREKLSQIMESLHPRIIEEISKDIYGDDDQRRLRAVQILGLLKKNPKVRDILAELVKERDEKIRATAIKLLGNLVGPHEQQVVLSLLNDPDKRVRANTVEAIEGLASKRLLPILLRFRKDPNNRIRGNVLKALYKMGHKDIGEDLRQMLASDDDFMKASGLWVVSQTGLHTPQIEELAGKNMVADSEMVASNAAKALKTLNTPRAQGFLRYLGPKAA
ncbi:MAG: hypothetical protein GF418_01650 [Chitinivibrionales bacterium]|nr:hypothetical protein [Chitinivibrionales bacterium]MBD3394306.1 hypothetical protein [Chitinivibrionales bacterium]